MEEKRFITDLCMGEENVNVTIRGNFNYRSR